LAPKTWLKVFKIGEYAIGGFVGINLLLIIASVNAQVEIPVGILAATGLMSLAWFACAEGIEQVCEKYGIDKNGNPKRKDNENGQK